MNIDLFQLKQQMLEMSQIGALAAYRMMNPAFDEVSYIEACQMAGSRHWLDHHIKAGNIAAHRSGTAKNSKKYFSRVEIYTLKQAEKITNQKTYIP